MPKSSPVPRTIIPIPPPGANVQNVLRRNQACHQCRKRKLKCDAALPCGPCSRSHAHASKLNPLLTSTEPECTYDNPDEVAEGPKGRISRLEARIGELEGALHQRDYELSRCVCRGDSSPSQMYRLVPVGGDSPRRAASSHSLDRPCSAPRPHSPPHSNSNMSMDMDLIPTPATRIFTAAGPAPIADQVFYAHWPPNLPPIDLLIHLAETFFTSTPLATRILHQPTFMASLRCPPESSEFPHVALLHAISALASLYTPIVAEAPSTLSETEDSLQWRTFYRLGDGRQGPRHFTQTTADVRGGDDIGFGASQIRWCSAAVQNGMQQGEKVIQLLQACVVAAWYSYTTGNSVSTFTWVGTASRLALPLGLNTSEGYEPLSRMSNSALAVRPNSRSPIESEMALNTFWITYCMGRLYTAGTVWPLSLSDDDCAQVMPCRLSDFIAGVYVPVHGRQYLFTHKMITTHPPLETDAFTLYVKASILVGKVKTFNIRFKMRHNDGQPAAGVESISSLPRKDPRQTPEFQELDKLVLSFISSFPKEFKNPVSGDRIDPILYTTHLLPYVAMILLHDPHADFTSPNCPSAERTLASARSILDLVYKMCATTYDLLHLDHACSFCWYMGGMILVRVLRAKMNSREESEVARLTQELGVIRFMLGKLGERATIGLRQTKLLDDLYAQEIGSYPATKTARIQAVP